MKFRSKPFIAITAAFILALIFTGCPLPVQSPAENQAPYPIGGIDPVAGYYDGGATPVCDVTSPSSEFTLLIDNGSAGLKTAAELGPSGLDPDSGDLVTFEIQVKLGIDPAANVEAQSFLEKNITLDEDTGILQIAWDNEYLDAQLRYELWTTDSKEPSDPITVVFRVVIT